MGKSPEMEQKETIINWIRPNLDTERGEIERVAKDFLGKEINKESLRQVLEILDNAPMVELSENLWESLENTDSFHDARNIEDVEKAIEEQNEELALGYKRDLGKLVEAFKKGSDMEAPIIIKKNGVLHLVSGNTRLMIARVLGIRPKVIIGEDIYKNLE